jgi:hypothetical protein
MHSLQLDELARTIFTTTEPLKIGIIVDDASGEYLFEMISNLLIEGLYVLYGRDFDVTKCDKHIFLKIQEALACVGFSVHKHTTKKDVAYARIAKINREHPYVFVLTHHPISSNKLSEYFMDMGDYQLSFGVV